MTTDCSLNYKFNTWKFQAQTWGKHVVYRNCFWHLEQFFYTTCSPHVLQKEELLTKIYLYHMVFEGVDLETTGVSMANIWEKASSILAVNFNSGLSYLIMTVKRKFREFPKLLFDTTNDKLRDLFFESFHNNNKPVQFPVCCCCFCGLPAHSITISPLWQWIINQNGEINREIIELWRL